MPLWLAVTYAAVIGAILGSFLNVCVYRWPAGLSVVRPRSRCSSCGAGIAWYDNVPVLSWIVLRARCRNCGAHISVQYPLVELACAGIWALCVAHWGVSVEALRGSVYLMILLGIALTDAKHMVIPDQLSLGGAALGLLFAAIPGGYPFLSALAGGALGYGFFWLVKLAAERAFRKPALGVGDIHMMAMIGAFTGVAGALLTVLFGSLLGLLIGVPLNWWRGRLSLLGTYLPLGTFLALGGAVAYLWGDAIIDWYLRLAIAGL